MPSGSQSFNIARIVVTWIRSSMARSLALRLSTSPTSSSVVHLSKFGLGRPFGLGGAISLTAPVAVAGSRFGWGVTRRYGLSCV